MKFVTVDKKRKSSIQKDIHVCKRKYLSILTMFWNPLSSNLKFGPGGIKICLIVNKTICNVFISCTLYTEIA